MDNDIKELLKKNNDLLQQIIDNTQSKYDQQIIVSRNTSEFNTIFNPPLILDDNKEYEIALVDLETYYSFPNISNFNNTIEYVNTRTKLLKRIVIPTGSYEFNGLNKEIERQLKNNGDNEAFELIANLNTFKSILNIKEGYKVKFTHAQSLKSILGFTGSQYNSGIHSSENIVNILEINSIFIHLNIINGSIVNGSQVPVIYSFFPKVSPGYKIIQKPVNPIYLPVTLKNIRDFYIKITDQSDRPLDLRGEEVTIRFHLRQK